MCLADRELIGDKDVGSYLTLCPEFSFVCESSLDGSVVGFACAASDARTFYTRCNVAWLPEMRLKYPHKAATAVATPTRRGDSVAAKAGVDSNGEVEGEAGDSTAGGGDEEMLTPLEQMAQSFHQPGSELFLPDFCSRTLPPEAPSNHAAVPTAASASATASSPWALIHMRISPSVADGSLPKRLTSLVLASLRAAGTFRAFVEADTAPRRDFYMNLGFRLVGPLPQQQHQGAAAATSPPPMAVVATPDASSPTPSASSASGGPGAAAIYMTRSF